MTSSAMAKASYTIGDRGIRPKDFRTATLGDARRLIGEIFDRNGWDERSRRVYFEMKGVTARRIEDLTIDEARKIVADMERSRMVIFTD